MRRSGGNFTELTHASPQVQIGLPQLQRATRRPFELHGFWSKDPVPCDLDFVLGYRSQNGVAGIVRAGTEGFLERFPYLQLMNDDRTGGTGEKVYGALNGVFKHITWIGVGLFNTNPTVPIGSVREVGFALRFDGMNPIVVMAQNGAIRSSACTLAQLAITKNGIQVLHDVGDVYTGDYPTGYEALMAHWNHCLWGSGK